MEGRQGDVNQGTTVDGEKQVRRGQSTRSSEEASNDRGAKGCRKVVAWERVGPHTLGLGECREAKHPVTRSLSPIQTHPIGSSGNGVTAKFGCRGESLSARLGQSSAC
jgi:hypothetical protein